MKKNWIIILLFISSFAFSGEKPDPATEKFIDEFLSGNETSREEREKIKNFLWEEITTEKIPLSVVQFTAKMMSGRVRFISSVDAADYLLKVIIETDLMLRKGYDPVKIRAIVRQQTANQNIAAGQIQNRIRNRYNAGEENLKRQLRKGKNDPGQKGNPKGSHYLSKGKDVNSPGHGHGHGPHGP